MTRYFAGVLILSLAACSPFGPMGCTLIGCDSGTTVHLESTPPAAFTVAVFVGAEAQQPAYVFDCPDPTKCGQDISFPGLIADRFVVRVTVGSASRTTELNMVKYVSSRPNGSGCDPVCRRATVSVAIPTP